MATCDKAWRRTGGGIDEHGVAAAVLKMARRIVGALTSALARFSWRGGGNGALLLAASYLPIAQRCYITPRASRCKQGGGAAWLSRAK